MAKTATAKVESAKKSVQVLLEKVQAYKYWLEERHHKDLLSHGENDFANLAGTYLHLCGQTVVEESPGPGSSVESYLFHYRLPEPFKNLALLYRDISLQFLIAENRIAEEEINRHLGEKLTKESQQVLINAVDSFITFIQQSNPDSTKPGKQLEKTLARTKHQQNPWPVYERQFQEILNQLELIEDSGRTTGTLRATFEEIRKYIKNITQEIFDNILIISSLIQETHEKLNGLTEASSLGEVIGWAEHAFENLKASPNGQEHLAIFLESQLKAFSEMELPVTTQDGLLVTRRLNLEKAVTKWFDYEILPMLIEFWNSGEALWTHLQISWANLKGGLTLAKTNKSLATLPNLTRSVDSMQIIVKEYLQKQEKESEKIDGLLDANLKVSRLLEDEEFLEVSLQSSIAQYSLAKDHLLNRLRNRIKTIFTSLGEKYEEASLPTEHRHLEASLECLHHRMSRESDSSYDTLFRNKALLGDLFIVNREDRERLFAKSFSLWNQGFNQSALVIGERLSGKTTLMEVLGRKYFAKNLIKLEVNGLVSIEGRKLQLKTNLGEALKLVEHSIHQSRPMIMVDNLENWRGDGMRLLENVRSLLRFLERKSDDVYTVVSTTVAMQQHLDQWIPFTNGFSTMINVNKSKTEEIYRAVLVRHGAAHKQLVALNGQPLTTGQIEKGVKDLCRAMDHNIGEILQAWTYNTVAEQKNIVYEDKQLPFEDFFSWHEISLLKYILLYGNIDEITVKHLYGVRSALYMSGLKKLINTKVLLRAEDGQLHLNPVIQKDVRDILKYRGILN